MHEYIIRTIAETHVLWEQRRVEAPEAYRGGYAVLYSPPRERPDLFLVGQNPGGKDFNFNGHKEELRLADQPMEYMCWNYALAVKTREVFASRIELLAHSMKTNLNFFRSGGTDTMPTEDAATCLARVIEMIRLAHPRVLFCETMGVLDTLLWHLYGTAGDGPHRRDDRAEGGRLYRSYRLEADALPRLVIGVPHLSSGRTRVTSEERKTIAQLLNADLEEVL